MISYTKYKDRIFEYSSQTIYKSLILNVYRVVWFRSCEFTSVHSQNAHVCRWLQFPNHRHYSILLLLSESKFGNLKNHKLSIVCILVINLFPNNGARGGSSSSSLSIRCVATFCCPRTFCVLNHSHIIINVPNQLMGIQLERAKTWSERDGRASVRANEWQGMLCA